MSTDADSQLEAAEKEWLEAWKRGPQRTRWANTPLQVGDKAPDFELQAMDGRTVHLREFWSHSAALLLFWRHYGCSCGIDRARRLQQEYTQFVQAGANVVVIGQGEPERAARYAKKNGLDCPVLCDPTHKVYQAYDLLEGKVSQVMFDASEELLRCDYQAGVELAQSRHGTDRALVDSPWQMPGEFVVDRTGMIRLAYRYQYCEDWPNPLVHVAAIKEAVSQPAK